MAQLLGRPDLRGAQNLECREMKRMSRKGNLHVGACARIPFAPRCALALSPGAALG
jgi:hypothetical protein